MSNLFQCLHCYNCIQHINKSSFFLVTALLEFYLQNVGEAILMTFYTLAFLYGLNFLQLV